MNGPFGLHRVFQQKLIGKVVTAQNHMEWQQRKAAWPASGIDHNTPVLCSIQNDFPGLESPMEIMVLCKILL